MGIAREKALGIRRRFIVADFLSDDVLDRIVRRHRLQLRTYPFCAEISEVWYGNGLVLRDDLDHCTRRWEIGHGLGHHLLHRGNRFALSQTELAKLDCQAEEFAGSLFLARSWDRMEPWELAEYHQLPEERIRRWLQIIAGDAAVSADWHRTPR